MFEIIERISSSICSALATLVGFVGCVDDAFLSTPVRMAFSRGSRESVRREQRTDRPRSMLSCNKNGGIHITGNGY